MNEQCDTRSEGQLRFLRELLEEGASIDGDVVEIAGDTWIVHGVAGYDGEIPMAVFDTYDEARLVLDEVLGPWGSEYGAMSSPVERGLPMDPGARTADGYGRVATVPARPSLRRDEPDDQRPR